MARKKRTKREPFDILDWLAWAIKLLVPAIFLFLWQTNGKLSVIDAKIDSHSDQLKAIWERLGKHP